MKQLIQLGGGISVIIPAYNASAYIDRCLESLIQQNINVPYEIIVVNDGSKDDTLIKLQQWERNYAGIVKVFTKENGGQSSARNYALDLASGEYITFVDSDDYVEPDFLSILYQRLVDTQSDISMCAINSCRKSDGKGQIFPSGFSQDFETEDVDSIIIRSSFSPWNKMFRLSIIGTDRFPVGVTYEDFAFIPQLLNRAKKIVYTHKVLYHYFVNPTGTIGSHAKKTNRDILKAQHILEQSELKNKTAVLENMYLRRVIASMSYTLVANKEDYDLSRQLVIEGIEKYPSIVNNPHINRERIGIRLYLKLVMKQHFMLAVGWVRLYTLAYDVYKRIRKR